MNIFFPYGAVKMKITCQGIIIREGGLIPSPHCLKNSGTPSHRGCTGSLPSVRSRVQGVPCISIIAFVPASTSRPGPGRGEPRHSRSGTGTRRFHPVLNAPCGQTLIQCPHPEQVRESFPTASRSVRRDSLDLSSCHNPAQQQSRAKPGVEKNRILARRPESPGRCDLFQTHNPLYFSVNNLYRKVERNRLGRDLLLLQGDRRA